MLRPEIKTGIHKVNPRVVLYVHCLRTLRCAPRLLCVHQERTLQGSLTVKRVKRTLEVLFLWPKACYIAWTSSRRLASGMKNNIQLLSR